MKVKLENSGKIVLVAILGIATYFGISHFKNKATNKTNSDSTIIVNDTSTSFDIDTISKNNSKIDTVKFVTTAKSGKLPIKRKANLPKQAIKPETKVESKDKSKDRGSLEISNY